ncbi:MAG TPA: NlpC/P60 family protein, partial [Pseudonocardia sp.]
SVQNLVLAGSGATRCSGPAGRATHDTAADAAWPAEQAASFPLDDAPAYTDAADATAYTDAGDADVPAGLAPGEPAASTVRVGRPPRVSLRLPLYASVSATVLTATAAVAASAGPVAITPANAAPDLAAPSAGTAALRLTLPSTAPTPVTPQTLGGPAALLGPDAATAQGSDIVARAKSDAAALGAQQAQAATDGLSKAMDGTIPAHIAPPVGPALPVPAVAPARKATPAKNSAPNISAAPAGSGLGSRALALAKGKLGDPYVWGSSGPNAFDCSGLVVWAFKQLGKALPHSSSTLSTMGAPVSRGALQPGDLVFFYSPVSHVGIYAGNGMVLNATESGRPVQYSKLANMPFHSARRITI